MVNPSIDLVCPCIDARAEAGAETTGLMDSASSIDPEAGGDCMIEWDDPEVV